MLPAFMVIIVWDGERITISNASAPCKTGTQVSHLSASTTCRIIEPARRQLGIGIGDAKRSLKLHQYRSVARHFLICVQATSPRLFLIELLCILGTGIVSISIHPTSSYSKHKSSIVALKGESW